MNSYNPTKKGLGRQRIDRSGPSGGKSSTPISIATLKKQLRFPIDALSIWIYTRSTASDRFRRRKNLCNSSSPTAWPDKSAVMRNHVLSTSSPRRRDVPATDFGATEDAAVQRNDRDAALCVTRSRYKRRTFRAGAGGRLIGRRPNCPIGIGAQKIFGNSASHEP